MNAWVTWVDNPEFLLNIAVLVGIQTPARRDFLLNGQIRFQFDAR